MATLAMDNEMRRKNFFLSADLVVRAEMVARQLGYDFSQLTREAIRQFVENAEREALDAELAKACQNYRRFNDKFSAEWAQFETRVE